MGKLVEEDTPVRDPVEFVLLPAGYGAVVKRGEEIGLDDETVDVEDEWPADALFACVLCGLPAMALSFGIFLMSIRLLPCTSPTRNVMDRK